MKWLIILLSVLFGVVAVLSGLLAGLFSVSADSVTAVLLAILSAVCGVGFVVGVIATQVVESGFEVKRAAIAAKAIEGHAEQVRKIKEHEYRAAKAAEQ